MLSGGEEIHDMDPKIAELAIITIQVIRWAAIVVVMGLISTVIGASIYGSLGVMQ
jgi:hypothetical protein